MQVRLKHGNIRNAVFVKKSCIEFKNFIEKAVDHRDAGNYKEATYAAKNFEKNMKTGQNVCARLEAAYASSKADAAKEKKQKHNYFYC